MRALLLVVLLYAGACGRDAGHADAATSSMPAAVGGAGGHVSGGAVDAGATIIHVPPGSKPGHTGDAGVDRYDDNGFAVALPKGPLSTARIRGLVLDDRLQALTNAGASAGGAVFGVSNAGFFAIDEVYGEREADVVVRAQGYTEGRVRVPIRAGETSEVVVVLTMTIAAAVPDLAAGGSFALEEDEDVFGAASTLLTLTIPAGALQTAWGAAGAGRGVLSGVALNRAAQMATVASGMTALQADGTRVHLRGRGVFELHIAQGGTHFELTKPARVALPLWSDNAATVPATDADGGVAGEDRLYWFDAEQAAFVERGRVEQDAAMIGHVEIDRLGLWAIGQPMTNFDCVHGRIVDADGAPVAFAALRVTDVVRLDSVALFGGADGEFCADVQRHGTIDVLALGHSKTRGVVRADASLFSVARAPDADTAAICAQGSGGCIEFGTLTATLDLGCARATVTGGNSRGTGYWSMGDDSGLHADLPLDESTCLELPVGSALTFSNYSGAPCGSPAVIAQGSGLCGDDRCADLGVLRCCESSERCEDGIDGDCDDRIDEGCTCGGTACSGYANPCCTDDDSCGGRAQVSHACIVLDDAGRFDTACPTENAPDDLLWSGCCRMDGRCGLLDSSFGCVAREAAGDVFPLTATLAPVACTF